MNFYHFLLQNVDRDDKTGTFAKHVLDDCNYPSNKPYLVQLRKAKDLVIKAKQKELELAELEDFGNGRISKVSISKQRIAND